MKFNYAVILGGNALNIGIIEKIRSFNLKIVIIDFRKDINLDYDKHIIFDAKNPEVVEILKKEGINNIKLVYTSMDNAGLAQRKICKEYGLLYANKDSIINAHYKNLMHQKWQEKGLLNRKSFSLQKFDYEKISKLNSKYKIIIKPSNACASRGITILDNSSSKEKLLSAFNYAFKNTTNNFVNIEEFIEGTEFTVEMLGDNYGNVSVFAISKKYHTENTDNNKIAIKLHYNPLDIEETTQNKIAQFAIECYKSLGLKNTLGHLEILLKENGEISPIEIGARSSGFIASHLIDAVSNKCFLKEFIEVLKGKKIKNGLIPLSNISSMYYFYDIKENVEIKKEYNLTDFLNRKIKSIYFDRKNLIKGKVFSKLTQDTDRYGFEILVGDKNILTIEEVQKAENEFFNKISNKKCKK